MTVSLQVIPVHNIRSAPVFVEDCSLWDSVAEARGSYHERNFRSLSDL